jgi:hypothetical protein
MDHTVSHSGYKFHKTQNIFTTKTLRRTELTWTGRTASSGMLRRVALVKTDVSEELSTSFIRVTRIGELETTLAITSNRRTLRRNTYFYVTEHAQWCIASRVTYLNQPLPTAAHALWFGWLDVV